MAKCIANLRADLATIEHSRDQWKQAAQNSTDIAIRGTAKLRADLEAERARIQEVRERLCDDHRILLWDPNCPYCALTSEHQRAAQAEAQCAAMRAVCEVVRARLLGRDDPLLDQLEKAMHDDAGRDLLTAVRRLMEALDQAAAEAHSRCPDGGPFTTCPHAHCQAAAVARADPVLAGLRGAP